ncbi:MAG: zinc ribbon domain-containing protein [Caldilineales bacterium]
MIFFKLLQLVSFVFALALPQAAPPRLAGLDVQIWPEYDQPAVLVIINGTLAEDVPLPQSLQVSLPEAAVLHAIAYPDATGKLLSLAATTTAANNAQVVEFELDQPRFVVEYYADIITAPPARSFTLDFAAPYAAEQATLSLRQPARATALQTDPPMAAGAADAQGNPTYTLATGPLQAGERIALQVSYTKPDADPSVSAQVTPAPANAVVAAQQAETSTWLPWLLGALAALLLGAAGFYWLRQRNATPRSRQARRQAERQRGPSPRAAGTATDRAAASANNFCPQCGQKYESNDKFCRKCGTSRR